MNDALPISATEFLELVRKGVNEWVVANTLPVNTTADGWKFADDRCRNSAIAYGPTIIADVGV